MEIKDVVKAKQIEWIENTGLNGKEYTSKPFYLPCRLNGILFNIKTINEKVILFNSIETRMIGGGKNIEQLENEIVVDSIEEAKKEAQKMLDKIVSTYIGLFSHCMELDMRKISETLDPTISTSKSNEIKRKVESIVGKKVIMEDYDTDQDTNDDTIDDDYIKEVNAAYWAEMEEMKAGIHPTQILEKIENITGKGTVDYLDWNTNENGTIKVIFKNGTGALYDYKNNIFIK